MGAFFGCIVGAVLLGYILEIYLGKLIEQLSRIADALEKKNKE